ncbi:3021_t:CDS:2, partial [Scutellospora calospora]
MSIKKFKEIFYLLFILSLNVLNIYSFIPEPRGGHTALLVNNKIFFFGGSRPIPKTSPQWNITHQYNLSDEVFYLDLSSQFSVDLPPFTDLSSTSRIPFGTEKGTTVIGNNGIRIFLVGGVQQDMTTFGYNTTNSSFWIYNMNSQKWGLSEQGTTGQPMPRRRSTGTVIDTKGVIYIFGGRVEVDIGSSVFTIFDDLFTFNILTLEWKNLSLPNHPSKRSHCSATLMPDGKIIYIGGVTQSFPGQPATKLDMTEYANSPKNIDPRVGHTALLGGTNSYGLNQTTVYPNFVLLNVKSQPFQYSIITPSGKVILVITSQMSNITNDFGPSNETSSNIYLMNLSNYTWVTQYTNISTPVGTPVGTPTSTKPDIKLIVILCAVCFIG